MLRITKNNALTLAYCSMDKHRFKQQELKLLRGELLWKTGWK
jgi:hypothetical protein